MHFLHHPISYKQLDWGTITSVVLGTSALITAVVSIFVAKANQKRNERFLHYQYKLEELKGRIYKTPELMKEKNSNFGELLSILVKNNKEYARISDKMINEFDLDSI